MAKRHQRHPQGAVSRAIVVTNTGLAWSVSKLPTLDDKAISIQLTYTGSGSGTATLYTVVTTAPGGAQTAALSVAYSGAGTYTLAGSLGDGVFPALLSASDGSLSITLI